MEKRIRVGKLMEGFPDLRKQYDECAPYITEDSKGTIYRRGGTVQVWFTETMSGYVGPETWILPDTEWGIRQAKWNFQNLQNLDGRVLSPDYDGS